MMIVVALLVWVTIGAGLGLYQARRGHWRWIWLLYAVAGPFALNLVRLVEENERLSQPIPLEAQTGGPRPGLRVLAGVDGSIEALDAVRSALDLLGHRSGDVTLAMVVQYEINEVGSADAALAEPWRDGCTAVLEEARSVIAGRAGFQPSTVLLSGAPAETLRRYARSEAFDLIVVGRRGKGLSRFLLGSCASQLVKQASVPTLIVPPAGPMHDASSARREAVVDN